MRDILHGLFVELPVSVAIHAPWILILILLAAFLFWKFSGIFT
mgnify:CR=1|jgi:hypothetical protein